MNIWQALLAVIWVPIFAVLTPYLLYPYFTQYLIGLFDYVVFVFIFVIAGTIVADIFTTAGGKFISEIVV